MLTVTAKRTEDSDSYKLLRNSGIQYLKMDFRGTPPPGIATDEDGESRETLTNKDKLSKGAKQSTTGCPISYRKYILQITFPIQKHKITVQICGNFSVTQ